MRRTLLLGMVDPHAERHDAKSQGFRVKLLSISAVVTSLTLSLLVGCASPIPPDTAHVETSKSSEELAGSGASPAESRQPSDAAAAAKAVREIAQSPWGHNLHGARWEHFSMPGKLPTRFRYEVTDGRDAVVADARSSASLLRKTVRVEAQDLGHIRFSWKVPALIAGADMAQRDKDDSPVRIVLAFDGDRSRFSTKDSMLAELTRAITGEEMPYATLMYVWSNNAAVGNVIRNPRTDRIRKIVLESGAQSLGHWREYDRDIRADYERAFGEPPGALIGVAIMTDSDNTRSVAKAWYGTVLVREARVSPALRPAR